MRLVEAVKNLIGVRTGRYTAPNARSAKPRYTWPEKILMETVYRVADVAAVLSEKQPFFKMRSGGTFAIAMKRNRKGELAPANFIRVDKDRRPWRERKAMRRQARALAEAMPGCSMDHLAKATA